MSSFRVKLTLAIAAAVKDPEIKQRYEDKAAVLGKLDTLEEKLYLAQSRIIHDRIRPGDDPLVKACRSVEQEISGVNLELAIVERKLYTRLEVFPEDLERVTQVVDTFTVA